MDFFGGLVFKFRTKNVRMYIERKKENNIIKR